MKLPASLALIAAVAAVGCSSTTPSELRQLDGSYVLVTTSFARLLDGPRRRFAEEAVCPGSWVVSTRSGASFTAELEMFPDSELCTNYTAGFEGTIDASGAVTAVLVWRRPESPAWPRLSDRTDGCELQSGETTFAGSYRSGRFDLERSLTVACELTEPLAPFDIDGSVERFDRIEARTES